MTRALLCLSLLLSFTACKKDPAPAGPVADKPAAVAEKAPPPPAPAGAPRTIEMAVTEDGFVPANVTVKKDQPVVLKVTRKTDATCANEILIDGTDINVKLPLNTPVEVAWTPKATGSVKYGCAMDKMVGGVLLVE